MRIGILSRSSKLYSTRRLIEAAREQGHDVEVIDYTQCQVLTERNYPKVIFKRKVVETLEAVIPRIGSSRTQFGTAVVRQFEMMGVFCANTAQAITDSRDKLNCLQILSIAGVGMPRTAYASDPSDIDYLMDQVGGAPVVIKLLQGTQGIGVVLAETKKAAKSVLEAFYGLNANMLIQEYIEEAKGADIRAFVVGGKVVAAMKRQGVEGEFRSNLHRGGSADVIRLSAAEEYTAVNAAKALGLEIAGVDMLQSERGPLILEVNSSPGLEGIENASGTDIAGIIIDYIEKRASQYYRSAI